MSLNAGQVSAIIEAVRAHAMSTGLFPGGVTGYEPKSAPASDGVSASVFWGVVYAFPGGSGINSTAWAATLTVRCMKPFINQPESMIDPEVVGAAMSIMAAFSSGFTIGGLVRNVDIMGEDGIPLGMKMGYLSIDNKQMRVADVTVPLILSQEAVQNG